MKTYSQKEVVDACIVGGAIGGVMARILAEGGLSVVVLDAGPRWNPARDFVNDPWEMEKKMERRMPFLYAGDATGRGELTVFAVGGRMNHWGASTPRYRPAVFLSKTMQGFGNDWPLTYDDLLPAYQKAEREFGVSGDHTRYPFPRDPFPLPAHPIPYSDQVVKKGFDALGLRTFQGPHGILSQAYAGRPACNYCGFCHYGCPTNSKANPLITHIPQAIAADAELRTGCYVKEIRVDQSRRANGVVYVDPDGKEQQQKARMVIVASGPPLSRLLLLSKSKLFPDGLANNNGQVGKNVFGKGGTAAVWGIYEQRLEAYRGFATLNCYDFIESDEKRGFVGGFAVGTQAAGFRRPEQLIEYASPGWGPEFKTFLKDFYPHCIGLNTGESSVGPAHEKNSVDLHPEAKDEWGLPLARVAMYRTENDRAMRKLSIKTMTDVHRAAGAVKIFLEGAGGGPVPMDRSNEDRPPSFLGGDCRMGKDPKTSVVNSYSQSHEVKNLFLLGVSTMVSGGHGPVTLTLVALANRAGEYILKNKRDIFTTA